MLQCIAVLSLLLFSSAALAQEPEGDQRAFRRVFGSSPALNSPERLNVTFGLSGVSDGNILSDRLGSSDPRVGQGGAYPVANGSLDYARTGRRAGVTATAMSGVQYYPSLGGRVDQNHSGTVGLNLTLSRRTTAQLMQSAAYSTYYTLLGLPGATQPDLGLLPPTAPPPAPVSGSSLGVSQEPGTEYHSFASLERQLGRRGSIEGHYGFGLNRFPSRETLIHDVGGTYRRTLGRALGLRAGYSLQTGGRPAAGAVLLHNLDSGVDYSRNLPGLRNTSISFSSGSTILQLERGRQYALRVNAALVHLMGRSWTTTVTYNRGAQVLAVVGDVLQSDSLTATIGGFASPRIELSFSGAYSKGYLGLRRDARTLTYNGATHFRFGLSSRFALEADFRYFLYDFAETATLPQSLPFADSRQRASVGLLVDLPLIR